MSAPPPPGLSVAARDAVRAQVKGNVSRATAVAALGMVLAIGVATPVDVVVRFGLLIVGLSILLGGLILQIRFRGIERIVRSEDWKPARFFLLHAGGRAGVQSVILLNDDIDHPDLAMVSGTWSLGACQRAAANGLWVATVGGRMVATVADGSMVHTLYRPTKLMYVAEKYFALVRATPPDGIGSRA